uniref:Retrovirus-related Pol polyprotein from transposon TNT 1-94 n=1 Tax=Cajanus cajan TaxID=3821 RepID=A0A151TLQ8_CAJCA|nr:hypothetical protein KK1_021608 [Cajanus cajan]
MVSTFKLFKHKSNTLTDSTFYKPVVGALQYSTITRLEISFIVSMVCQFMDNPLKSHWNAIKRTLRYLEFMVYT